MVDIPDSNWDLDSDMVACVISLLCVGGSKIDIGCGS